jgi:hypothetical protein
MAPPSMLARRRGAILPGSMPTSLTFARTVSIHGSGETEASTPVAVASLATPTARHVEVSAQAQAATSTAAAQGPRRNSMHPSMLSLAAMRASQQREREEIDSLRGHRSPRSHSSRKSDAGSTASGRFRSRSRVE